MEKFKSAGNNQTKSSYNELSYVKAIHSGSQATLYEGEYKGEKVAIKVFDKQYLKENLNLAKAKQEYLILKELNHPNVLGVIGVVENSTSIVLEFYSERDLDTHLFTYSDISKNYVQKKDSESTITITTNPEILKLEQKESIIESLLKGMSYLKENGVLNCDIKSENILLQKEKNKFGKLLYKVVIGDFGHGEFVGSNNKKNNLVNSELATYTITFIAPETVDVNKANTFTHVRNYKTEMYSAALICREVLLVLPAYPEIEKCLAKNKSQLNDEYLKLVYSIKIQELKGEYTFRKLPENTPSNIRLCIEHALRPDPKKRVDATDALDILLDKNNSAVLTQWYSKNIAPNNNPSRVSLNNKNNQNGKLNNDGNNGETKTKLTIK